MANSSKASSLITASMAVAMAGVFSKVLGFIRTMAIAAVFGTSAEVDAYVVAHGIPGFIFGLVGSAVGTVVIPLFTRKRVSDGEKEAFRMAGTVWNVLTIAAIIILILGELLMPTIVKLVAPGFQGKVYEYTVLSGRIMMPMVICLGLHNLSVGMLNSLQMFGLAAFSGPLQNIAIILMLFTLGRVIGIQGLAIASLLGSVLSLSILIYALGRRGFKPGYKIDWRIPELREIIILALPVAIGSSISTINGLVDKILASSLPEGNVAAMDYAFRLYGLPMTFFGTALGTVLYPTFAEFAAKKEKERMVGGLRRSLCVGALGMAPLSAGILVLAGPITKVVYERGVFSVDATILTAGILIMYMVGVPAMYWRFLTVRAFYAEGDTRTPLWTGVLSVITNICFNFLLVESMGARGLALATSLSYWTAAISLMLFWDIKHKKRDYPKLINGSLILETFKITLSTGIMYIIVRLFWINLAEVKLGLNPSNLYVLMWLVLSAMLGAAVYFLMVWILRVKEFRFAIDIGKKGFKKVMRKFAG
jgi:putative peptidoglycan lipid II flippase